MQLLDASSRRRWYLFTMRSSQGWQQPVYSLSSYYGQDAGFDLSHVKAVQFSQAGLLTGDTIYIGEIAFDVGLVDHGDFAGNWYQDWTCGGTISESPDAVAGAGSVLANVTACASGQVDVAIIGAVSRIVWNWSPKTQVSFFYKDSDTIGNGYFLIYDKTGNYREWLFTNDFPGHWVKVTADLNNGYYTQSAPIDLGNIVQFEVGIFGGPSYQNYSFQIDEVTVQ